MKQSQYFLRSIFYVVLCNFQINHKFLMNNYLYTVLGSNGPVGRSVVDQLISSGKQVRGVQRTIEHNPYFDIVNADILDKEQSIMAIKGSSVVFLCIGIQYSYKVWNEQWERIIENTIDACAVTNAKLIFLDNVYMYGPAPLKVPFDEKHSQKPVSRKGTVRKRVADKLIKAIENGKIDGLIARSADFYGPNSKLNQFYFSFLENMLNGKAPQSILKPNVPHTYAYTVDIAKALISLAENNDTYGQVWHLPVGNPITIDEVANIFNIHLGTNYKVKFLPTFVRNVLSVFVPMLKELNEMMYQFDNEYVMSWDKFRNRFPDFKVTSYELGIKQMIDSFKIN